MNFKIKICDLSSIIWYSLKNWRVDYFEYVNFINGNIIIYDQYIFLSSFRILFNFLSKIGAYSACILNIWRYSMYSEYMRIFFSSKYVFYYYWVWVPGIFTNSNQISLIIPKCKIKLNFDVVNVNVPTISVVFNSVRWNIVLNELSATWSYIYFFSDSDWLRYVKINWFKFFLNLNDIEYLKKINFIIFSIYINNLKSFTLKIFSFFKGKLYFFIRRYKVFLLLIRFSILMKLEYENFFFNYKGAI